jgi:hypothetical protein
MTCGGSHLEFPIGIKKKILEDHQMDNLVVVLGLFDIAE